MNKRQLLILGIIFLILMFLFIKIDSGFNCDMFSIEKENLSKADIWCVVNSEIYDPFIGIFGILSPLFFLWSLFEPKDK